MTFMFCPFHSSRPGVLAVPLLLILLSQLAANLRADSITVALDGSGQFKTVQSAIDSIPLTNDHPQTIAIKPGRYYEKA